MDNEELVMMINEVIADRITKCPDTSLLRKPKIYTLTGHWLINGNRWCLADRIEKSLIERKSEKNGSSFEFYAYDECRGGNGKRIGASLISTAIKDELPLIWVYTYLYNGNQSRISILNSLLGSRNIEDIRLHHKVDSLWIGTMEHYYEVDSLFDSILNYTHNNDKCKQIINQLIDCIESDTLEVINDFVIVHVDNTSEEIALFDPNGNKVNHRIVKI